MFTSDWKKGLAQHAQLAPLQVGFLVGELSNQGIACKGLGVPEEPWQQGDLGVRGSRLVSKLWLGN